MTRANGMFVLLCLASLSACGGEPREVADDIGTAEDTATATDTDGQTGTDDDAPEGGEDGSSGEESGGGGAACGNGVLELGELCDGDEFDDQTCADLGFPGGELMCADDCTIDATGCTESICGNNVAEGDEECDGADLGGLNCTDLGFGPGLPMCTDGCTFDTTTCPTLGEGDACGTLNPCENDLNCVSGTCYDGSPGDPCDMAGDCQSSSCVGATLFQDGVCG